MNKIYKYKISLLCMILIFFSLSCDETEPSAPNNPDLNYTLTIETEVKHCSIVGCIEDADGNSVPDEAYNANVISPASPDLTSWYHLLFRIQLRDIDGAPVSGATLTITEEGGESAIVSSKVETFTETTNDDGIIEGYWKDNGEYGDFTITVSYEDEFENSISKNYSITIHQVSNVVESIYANAAEDMLTILTNDIYTDTIYARVKNATNSFLENVDVTFEIIDGSGGLSSTIATTSKPEDDSPSAFAYVLYSTDPGVDNDTITIRTSTSNDEGTIQDNVTILLSSEVFPAEFDVDILLADIKPDTLVINTEDAIEDSTYQIQIDAIVKENNGQAVENVPINFENLNSTVGILIDNYLESDSTGTATALINIYEDEVSTKDSILIRSYISHPEVLDSTLHELVSTIYVYSDEYLRLEAAEEIIVWAETEEIINNNNSITYQATLFAEVLNRYGATMPNMSILFDKTSGPGGFNGGAEAVTDSTGNAAQVVYELAPHHLSDYQQGDVVTVEFDISLIGVDDLSDSQTISYQLYGSSDPELDVTEFHYYPDSDIMVHDLYTETPISVVAKNYAGVGISDVRVQFSLQETNDRNSNGMLSEGTVYTCCSSSDTEGTDGGGGDDSGGEETGGADGGDVGTDGGGDDNQGGQSGIATVTYTNVEGGSDIVYATVYNPVDNSIIATDSLLIVTSDTCPGCVEELQVLSSSYELPTDNDLEQTEIYAFYTDSLGNSPEINSFINFKPWQQDESGDWVNVGSVSPENAIFVSGTAGELDDIFPNSPEDSAIVYANATFNMENASGLVKVVGSYLELTDTLGIQINSTGASFVEIIPPFPSQIAVQGSPDQESTILTAEIRDGNGNLVSDSYITRFTLGTSAMLAGVHFNGEEGVSDTYTYSSNGAASITLNSGQTPVSVGVTVKVYEMAEIASVDDLDALDVITEAQAVPVTIASGPPTSGIIGYSFLEAINIGGGLTELPVSIMLWDTWANPVADSISVYFTLDPPNAASIIAEAKTGNIKPNGTPDDTWPGIAWTTIQYNASQLFNFPEILATTTGNICSDNVSSYQDCIDAGETWLTEVPLQFSSLDNIVSYQNVCVDCGLTLVPLTDTQYDFQCNTQPPFQVDVRAQLLDFYGVPVEGAIVELLIFGSQGAPTIEAYEYLCYWDTNGNGQYDQGEEQTDEDGNPLDEDACDLSPMLTWGQAFFPEPPSTQVFTDEFGLKYWKITFSENECIQTGADPDQYTCSTPSIQANLVNPNGALSEELNITINSTCFE